MDWLRLLLRGREAAKKGQAEPSRQKQVLIDSLDDILKTPGKGCLSTLRFLASASSRDEFINFVHCPSLVGARVRDGDLVAPVSPVSRQKTMLFNASLVNLFVEGGSIEDSIFLLRKAVGGSSSVNFRKFSIGRTTESDLAMIDFAISRSHALVELKQEGYLLTDLGSSNGTFVNGIKLGESGITLHDGDRVRFARYEFSFLSAGALYDLLKSRESS